MRFKNALLFVALAVAWGSAFTSTKAGLDYFPPILFASFRHDLAGLLMLGYAVYATDRWRPNSLDGWLEVGVVSVFIIATYHIFLYTGQQGTTSAVAGIVVSLSPILTAVFARAILPNERLEAIGILGLLVGFVGVGLIANPDPSNHLDVRTISIGLIFMASVTFALGTVLVQRIGSVLPRETLQAWAMLIGAVMLHGASLGLGETFAEVQWTPEALIALFHLVAVASGLGYLIFFHLLDRLGSIEINLVSYGIPVAAAATGLVFLGEVPTSLDLIGFALILVGFVLIKRRTIREELSRY